MEKSIKRLTKEVDEVERVLGLHALQIGRFTEMQKLIKDTYGILQRMTKFIDRADDISSKGRPFK